MASHYFWTAYGKVSTTHPGDFAAVKSRKPPKYGTSNRMGPLFDSVQLPKKVVKKLWFLVDITHGGYIDWFINHFIAGGPHPEEMLET